MTSTPAVYPPTRREDFSESLHGQSIPDPYRWLEDDHSSQTEAWVQAQNRLTNTFLADIPQRQSIQNRLTELWDYEKFGAPFKRGGRYFFTRNDGLQNQPVLYWMEDLAARPRELLDPNRLSEDGTVALSGYTVSRDGQFLAYGLSGAGSDWQEWRVRRVSSAEDLPDLLRWVKFSEASFTPDNRGFYYSRYDAPPDGAAYKGANYFQKLYYHTLGTDQSADRLIYERHDEKEWGFEGEVTEDGQYLVISVWRGTSEENGLFLQNLTLPDSPVIELRAGFDASYHFLGSDGGRFYLVTDKDAPRRRVVALDVDHPDRLDEVVPESADSLEQASLVGDTLLCVYLHDAHSEVRLYDLQGEPQGAVSLPGLGSVSGFDGSREDRETFYLYTSFTSPGEVYRYDLDQGESSLLFRPNLKFDPSAYQTSQVFYHSKDGTRVPMFLTAKKGMQPNGQNPTLLYGYGGFNIPVTPAFSPAMLAWMEMGGLYAVANLRGGGEYGKAWHEGGMKHAKQNVFDDFISAGEWLIANRYTTTPHLAIHGRSNGGLLAGACLVQRPDLVGAAVVTVGVLDMLRFHKFTIGWAWVSDYGSPDAPEDFPYLLAYSPYHNVHPGTHYPPTLITTGDHDDRVFPAHSFKFAAALQAAQGGSAPVLIRIDTQAGHGAGKPTGKLIAEWSDILAFLQAEIGSGKAS